MTDIQAITELMATCDQAESRMLQPTEDEVLTAWQTPGFCLESDAWVIMSNNEEMGKIVGYADVRQHEPGQFEATIRVHPAFRRRGIGTLLLWLVEDRARRLSVHLPALPKVTLHTTASSANTGARQLLEREGYRLVRHFWRLVIDRDEVPVAAQNGATDKNRVQVDLVLDTERLPGVSSGRKRTGFYTTHRYDVYEKELRVACPSLRDGEQSVHLYTGK